MAQLNLKAHPAKGKGKAGLYLNPSSARLAQEGPEIINAPNGDQIFGAAAPTAIPVKPSSAIGVSITLSGPNSSNIPCDTL